MRRALGVRILRAASLVAFVKGGIDLATGHHVRGAMLLGAGFAGIVVVALSDGEIPD